MDEAVKQLLQTGILGVVVLGLVGWILRKDAQSTTREKEHKDEIKALAIEHAKELAALKAECDKEKEQWRLAAIAEKDARIDDAKGYAGLCLKLQESVMTYVQAAKAQDEKVADRLVVLTDKLALVGDGIARNTNATEELNRMLRGSNPR